MHRAAALFAADGDPVDVGPVEFEVLRHVVSERLELRARADHVPVAALAHPYRQRRAPVPLAREAPIDHVFEEVAHASFLDVVRHPVDRAVRGEQPVADGRHADEPRRARVVDQRRVAAPAERVVVLEALGLDEQPVLFEHFDDQRVGVLDEFSRPRRLLRHLPLGVDQLQKRQVVRPPDARVVLTERRRLVDDAGAVGHRDVVVRDDAPRALVDERALEVEQRLVLDADELAPGHRPGDFELGALAEHGRDQRLAHDDRPAAGNELGVLGVGVHAQRDVRRKRPRRRRPRVEPGVLAALDAEAHERGPVRHQFVALRNLVRRERGSAARAVGHDLVALVEKALVGDLLQAPPDGLDVAVLVGDVGIFHVQPEADALGHLFPLALVLPDGLLALLDERLDAVGLDLLLAVEPQLLFDLELDRQAVRVPAGLAQDVFALHRLIARDHVLERARLDVADVRLAVRGRRAVVERERLGALAQLDRLLEDLPVVPELDDLLLAREEVEIRGYLLEHAKPSEKNMTPSSPLGRSLAVPPKLAQKAPARGAVTGVPGGDY